MHPRYAANLEDRNRYCHCHCTLLFWKQYLSQMLKFNVCPLIPSLMQALYTTTFSAMMRVPVHLHLDIDCPPNLSKELTNINLICNMFCFHGIRHSDLYLIATSPKSTNPNPSWDSACAIAMNCTVVGWLVSPNSRKIGLIAQIPEKKWITINLKHRKIATFYIKTSRVMSKQPQVRTIPSFVNYNNL